MAFSKYLNIEMCLSHDEQQTTNWTTLLDVCQLVSPFYCFSQIATNRRMTVKYNPPSSCILEISVKGVKLSVQEEYYASDRVRRNTNTASLICQNGLYLLPPPPCGRQRRLHSKMTRPFSMKNNTY